MIAQFFVLLKYFAKNCHILHKLGRKINLLLDKTNFREFRAFSRNKHAFVSTQGGGRHSQKQSCGKSVHIAIQAVVLKPCINCHVFSGFSAKIVIFGKRQKMA
jgi:hypothetical protein